MPHAANADIQVLEKLLLRDGMDGFRSSRRVESLSPGVAANSFKTFRQMEH